jgi:hypothetical protein
VSEKLARAYVDAPKPAADLLYRPTAPAGAHDLAWACETIEGSPWPLREDLMPLLPVDDASFACAVVEEGGDVPIDSVVRWHLGVEDGAYQGKLLDSDVDLFVKSVAEELGAREAGLTRMLDEIGPWYESCYLAESKRPKDFVLRPVRLACQNVIAGLGAFTHVSSLDGMAVLAWQTCEVPHVGTHEANRALAALLLCDAYQSGGTMEIRFDWPVELDTAPSGPLRYEGHPEMTVPASLRRYGRTVGLELGSECPGSISPTEARDLFLSVTPMPAGLERRIHQAAARGVASPERLCYTLLSGVWRDVEVDFLLGTSERAGAILRGGAHWEFRSQRQAETQLARAALMIGMLHRRLDAQDSAGAAGETRVLEDCRAGVAWSVVEELGAVMFEGLRAERMPWQDGSAQCEEGGSLLVLPRPFPSAEDVEAVRSLAEVGPAAIVVPDDADLTGIDVAGVIVLRCPDRLGELDLAIESNLLKLRLARA